MYCKLDRGRRELIDAILVSTPPLSTRDHRFSLSLRDVEDLLAERGVIESFGATRAWCRKFGPGRDRDVRRWQGRLGDIRKLSMSVRALLEAMQSQGTLPQAKRDWVAMNWTWRSRSEASIRTSRSTGARTQARCHGRSPASAAGRSGQYASDRATFPIRTRGSESVACNASIQRHESNSSSRYSIRFKTCPDSRAITSRGSIIDSFESRHTPHRRGRHSFV